MAEHLAASRPAGAPVATAVDLSGGLDGLLLPRLCDRPLVARPHKPLWTTPGSRGRSSAAVPLCHENSEVTAGVALAPASEHRQQLSGRRRPLLLPDREAEPGASEK